MNAKQRLEIASELLAEEGFQAKPYRCQANKLTIGIGRNLEDNGISVDEAMIMLQNDINGCVNQLIRHLDCIYLNLDPNRRAILINMNFNMGMGNLLKFRRMLQALEVHDYEKASKEMLDSLWARQVPKRAKRLANRMLGK